jgi:hypothetical protein
MRSRDFPIEEQGLPYEERGYLLRSRNALKRSRDIVMRLTRSMPSSTPTFLTCHFLPLSGCRWILPRPTSPLRS